MIFKSIRGRLQLWYGVILVAVLTGFGVTSYQLERGRQFRNFDEEMQRRIAALTAALRPPPMRPRGPGERPNGRPPPPEERLSGRPFADGPPDRPPNPPSEFRLPTQQAALFDESNTNAFYYVIWLRDGRELARSTNAPADTLMPDRPNRGERTPPRMRGPFREVILTAPWGGVVMVGRSIALEMAELRRVAWGLTGVGGVVLLLGLAGGWWIATRAIHPITDISTAAVKIAAGDLSQRIDVADTDNELGRLAGVLNSTFARLESAFTQQGRFTSDAAHELRTPISVMLTQTQTTLGRERNAAEYRETVEACQRAAQRMRRLIESLLELARLDAGQEPIRRLRFDLSHTAQDCVEQIRPLADQRGVRILCELPPLECEGDAERIARVITNLLTNAIQYNRDGGELRVNAQNQDGTAVLCVADTGPGISESDLPHIFERFYRADKSRSGSSGHAGLGLPISKAIVEGHGGTIEVSSKVGAGTTFTVRLPSSPSR